MIIFLVEYTTKKFFIKNEYDAETKDEKKKIL